MIEVVNAIFGPDGINPKHRQTRMVRVAKALNAPYEWQIHSAIGRNVGLSEDEIAAFASDGPVKGVGPDAAFMITAHNLILVGGTGTGKPTSPRALSVAAIHQGKRVRFYNAVDLVSSTKRRR